MIHNHPQLMRLLIEDRRVQLEHDATTWNRRAPKRRHPTPKPAQP
jgi:hypothetical protein